MGTSLPPGLRGRFDQDRSGATSDGRTGVTPWRTARPTWCRARGGSSSPDFVTNVVSVLDRSALPACRRSSRPSRRTQALPDPSTSTSGEGLPATSTMSPSVDLDRPAPRCSSPRSASRRRADAGSVPCARSQRARRLFQVHDDVRVARGEQPCGRRDLLARPRTPRRNVNTACGAPAVGRCAAFAAAAAVVANRSCGAMRSGSRVYASAPPSRRRCR